LGALSPASLAVLPGVLSSTRAGWTDHDTRLVACALSAVVGIVVLIAVAKVHPFIALIAGSLWLGISAGLPAEETLSAFEKGVGETLGSVGVVVALGTMFGKLLADSGGADRVVSVILARAGPRGVPWAMALAAMVIGVPIFFEVGVVLLMPMILLFARKTGGSVLRVGIPALAGLSVLHGLVPPHPGPLIAAATLQADLGKTLAYGLVVALPTLVIAGPLFGELVARRIRPQPPAQLVDELVRASTANAPGFAVTIATILLPVALMLARTVVDLSGATGLARTVGGFVGRPVVAMLVSVATAMFTFGYARGAGLRKVGVMLGEGLVPIGAIVMIIGAGGGFKQTLVASGLGDAIGKAAHGSHLPPLLLGWLVAVAIRVATGSATVATITASGMMAPLALATADVGGNHAPLLALAIGAGSLFFSHVNDAGFWLVKEYFGMSVDETLRSWSAMETLISVVAILGILGLSAIL
jgi:GntP family gluconate:H+ symporter